MNALAQFFVTLAAVIVGLPIARLLDIAAREYIRRRRHEQLEKAVIAELISRGVDVSHVNLQQLSRNIPPRVTPEYVKQMVDQIEGWMKMTTEQEERPDV
jgi:hypothetical protein